MARLSPSAMRPIKASSDVSWTAGRKCGDATSRSTYWFCMTIPFSQPLIKLTNRRLLLGCYVVRENGFVSSGNCFVASDGTKQKVKNYHNCFVMGHSRN